MGRKSRPYWHEGRKRWRFRWDGNEHFDETGLGRDQVAAAWAMLEKLKAGMPTPVPDREPPRPSLLTVEVVLELYLAHMVEIGSDSKAISDRKTHCGHIARVLGRHDARKLTTAHAGLFRDFLATCGYSANYQRGLISTLKVAFNWAVTRDHVDAHPFGPIKKPPSPRLADRYTPSGDIRRFLRRLAGRARHLHRKDNRRDGRLVEALLRFLYLTGARPKEACHLRWSDVDWRNGRVTFRPDRHKTGHATGANRTVYLTRRAEKLLREVERKGVRLDGLVFGQHRGPWTTVALGHHIRAARQSIGFLDREGWYPSRRELADLGLEMRKKIGASVGHTSYANRHAYCTEAVQAGMSYEDLSKIVGNSPEVLRAHYDHPVHDRLAKLVKDFESRRGRAS